ncbi:hypothetical protein MHBO_000911 [Bonamia ostreae]|uniref:Uncharacterized protein n=1 Tax=Bonamia ostreae TaxID=126728 RepID=A0ABV2AHX0_9EUKA
MGQTKSKYVMEMEPDSSFSHADPDEAIEMFEEDSRQVPSVVENVEPFPASPKAFEEPLQAGKETDKAVKGKVVNTNPDAKVKYPSVFIWVSTFI